MTRVQFQLLFSFFVIAIGVFPSAETCEKPDKYAKAERSCYSEMPTMIGGFARQFYEDGAEMCILTSLNHLSNNGFDRETQDAFYREHIHDEQIKKTVLTAIARCRFRGEIEHETIGKAREFHKCVNENFGLRQLLEKNLCK